MNVIRELILIELKYFLERKTNSSLFFPLSPARRQHRQNSTNRVCIPAIFIIIIIIIFNESILELQLYCLSDCSIFFFCKKTY